jgi:glutamate synthase (ferredoxin)|uniref:Ferredoxin-dependent glutamate synthase n=1 Tax=Thorea hispida TaxID=202687 RepID=A0A1C9CAH7_9FLOR|nr:ferredoxin-dependent glutamate synthase [Thorea hispida]AOM65374.1 ferredoxin-dependent glutamate synthase [Thorea hispida]
MQASRSYTYRIDGYLRQPVITQERDSCGVGFLVETQKSATHRLIVQALESLTCMEHRGACSADRDTGDGAGITTHIPWDLFNNTTFAQAKLQKTKVGVAMVFFPTIKLSELQSIFNWVLLEENFIIIKWRKVPIRHDVLGSLSRKNCPIIQQCFVESPNLENDDLERALYAVRKKIEKIIAQAYEQLSHDFYICSFSSRIIVYKGMMRSAVLGQFYEDLYNPYYKSIFAIYHRRFSTNTMPKWPLAQPMRFIAHNGEINTLLGNLNWMRSREPFLFHPKLMNYLDTIKPITNLENSDSANLDAVFELLIASGMTPEQALMILIPEAYQNQPVTKCYQTIVDFYEYYSHLQEPWDGPALVVFTDGKHVGATLDRNGLRPARYCITSDGLVALGSETGVLELDVQKIIEKGRLGPGQMFSVDIITQEVLNNLQIKSDIAGKFTYHNWLLSSRIELNPENYLTDFDSDFLNLMRMHTAFGYSNEDVELVIEHMASSAKEPTFCMGDDIPLSILSNKPHVLFDYFKQRFAQVTNPAIDSLRENLVMSLSISLGPKGNLLDPTQSMARSIKLSSPILNELELKKIEALSFKVYRITTFFMYTHDNNLLKSIINDFCKKSSNAVLKGVEILILTDRSNSINVDQLFIPPLLLVGAIHHHLIQKNLRQNVSIIVDTAQCWNTHHFACLIGYGANAICPYLAFKTARQWWYQNRTQKLMEIGKLNSWTIEEAQNNYRIAIEKGLLKILSKMGISLLSSYQGAQIFEILGLGFEVIDIAFKGTVSRVGGMSLNELLQEIKVTYHSAFSINLPKKLPNFGYVQYRPGAEYHVNNPEMSKVLHKAVRSKNIQLYNAYKQLLIDRPPTNLRDLLEIKSIRSPISIDEVEPVDSIMQRFCTGGMSLGALSRETHETLAIAMNRIGGKSNSGEGGEDPERFTLIENINNLGLSNSFPHLKGLKDYDLANSAIKQIASGRFGVTPQYLVNAKQLEIKIAQGAKPGEGGQLPGKKVSSYIAKLRNCKPGVTLISPPPHHDIYSIEDLAQLIFDLHQINPDAQVSVKLVSEIGIGTVAAGVAKGNADIIQISGHDGGTGASPLSSIKHAGVPWELGLTEVHQLLSNNHLRNRIILRVDGGLRTGRDIILATLMGAEEYGFGTIAMIATGCVMARICHTNNCPVGVATQRQDLRNRYPGIPSDLVNFFFFIAQEARGILASLGYKKLHDLLGNTNLLRINKNIQLHKTKYLHLNSLLMHVNVNNIKITSLDLKAIPHNNGYVLDDQLLLDPNIIQAIKNQTSISKKIKIFNIHRTVGARISGKIAKIYGDNSFQGHLYLYFQGSAGQSFGAFIGKGMHFILSGEANDYVGKGMNGGEIIIIPPASCSCDASNQVILGNTCLYGATGGILFARGRAGERFAVRNSLAQAVVEGVGDHCCEYMTGGVIVVIGQAGRNIAAGMTGGLAYFLDEENNIILKVNKEIVTIQRIITKEAECQLKDLIKLHAEKTFSQKAQQILQAWNNYLPLFWQVVPPSEMNLPVTNSLLSEFTSLK